MTQIKFYCGSSAGFVAGNGKFADGIYFSSDERVIYARGKKYGLTKEEAAVFAGQMISVGEGDEAVNYGLISENDLAKITALSSLLEEKDGSLVLKESRVITVDDDQNETVSYQDGLMTAEQAELLDSVAALVGTGDSEGGSTIVNRVDSLEDAVGTWAEEKDTISEVLSGVVDDLGVWDSETNGTLADNVQSLNQQISGLSGAMHFIGSYEVLPQYLTANSVEEGTPAEDGWYTVTVEDETNVYTKVADFVAGDVILVGHKEYILNKEKSFIEFGDEGSLATKDELKQKFDAVIAGAGLNADGTYSIDLTSVDGETEVNSLAEAISSLDEVINTNKSAIDVLNGTAEVDGSVAKTATDIARAEIADAMSWIEIDESGNVVSE